MGFFQFLLNLWEGFFKAELLFFPVEMFTLPQQVKFFLLWMEMQWVIAFSHDSFSSEEYFFFSEVTCYWEGLKEAIL